jgi:putative tryptophan/tyrosine transport system substrate-binding protein
MRRREFITLLGGAAAWPLAARAQQAGSIRRVGVLMGIANDAEGQRRLEVFRQALQQLGWSEGRNLRIDARWGAGDVDRGRGYAAELLDLAPDVILASNPVVAAVQQVTRTIPIVFVAVTDPVGGGLVASLPHEILQCSNLHHRMPKQDSEQFRFVPRTLRPDSETLLLRRQ